MQNWWNWLTILNFRNLNKNGISKEMNFKTKQELTLIMWKTNVMRQCEKETEIKTKTKKKVGRKRPMLTIIR